MKNKGLVVIGTIILLIVAFFIGSHFYKKAEREKLEVLAKQRNALFVRAHSPTMGPEMAKVTLVEFLDPECEACRAFYPIVKGLLEEYKGSLRLVIRYAPFHGNSKFAVQLLEAARKQDKYWESMELFFKYQPLWGDHHNPNPDLLWDYLKEAGVDTEQAKKDMHDPAIQEMIKQDVADGQQLGARRTPTFFVNGQPLQQFGYEQLRGLIFSEINK